MSMGVRRGDIRNTEYAWKAKQYSWRLVSGLLPAGISPTDIDGCWERNYHFAKIECKTTNAPMHKGQRLFFERWLYTLKEKAALFIVEHRSGMEFVSDNNDLEYMSIWAWDNAADGIIKTHRMQASLDLLTFWVSEFNDLSDGRANSFRRGLRESVGVYPRSFLRDFPVVGGEVHSPPYSLSIQNTTYISTN